MATTVANPPAPPDDYPVLTEVVADERSREPAAAPSDSAPTPPSSPPVPVSEPLVAPLAAPAASAFDETLLARLEDDLRLELLGLMGPELERLFEAKLHKRLGSKIEKIIGRTKRALETEVRAAVRETLLQVIADETGRLAKKKQETGETREEL
jgi:hypothetical protein